VNKVLVARKTGRWFNVSGGGLGGGQEQEEDAHRGASKIGGPKT